MWSELDDKNKDTYKRLILAYASLSEAFAQKEDFSSRSKKSLRPIVNTKFQEASFQRAFGASAEDIGNTSFDVAIHQKNKNGQTIKKFLIGIKTFGLESGTQKIAQFKKEHDSWTSLLNQMKSNVSGKKYSIDEVNLINHDLYLQLAIKIAELRNQRIKSSIANLHGFKVDTTKDPLEYVYHVLMPSNENDQPVIHVGEMEYSEIDIDNIKIEGCTSADHPTNFIFSDNKHIYKFTPADSQLYMSFDNKNIIKEKWDVIFADDAYAFFLDLADKIYGKPSVVPQRAIKSKDHVMLYSLAGIPQNKIVESYSWLIAQKDEVEIASGFNSFYGTGLKQGKIERQKRIDKIFNEFQNVVPISALNPLVDKLKIYCSDDKSLDKFVLREDICSYLDNIGNDELSKEVKSFVFRPLNEMYIPIPEAKVFHTKHPNFFGKDIGTFIPNTSKLALEKDKRAFTLIFEPSETPIKSFITQDNGKGIESSDKQSVLGKWIRNGVFQLNDYERLTKAKLDELEINGIRVYKTENKLFENDSEFVGEEIHIEFIWIDVDNLPADFIGKCPKD